jgi:acetylornithine deacetylase/succinyl-diaminopimelate desuccinylase-like protein
MRHGGTLEPIQNVIADDQDFIVSLMREVILTPSVHPKFQAEAALNIEADGQSALAREPKQITAGARREKAFPDRPSPIPIPPGKASRNLLLNGHIDAVPTGNADSWTADPFEGELRHGRNQGRGTLDMKATGTGAGFILCRLWKLRRLARVWCWAGQRTTQWGGRAC